MNEEAEETATAPSGRVCYLEAFELVVSVDDQLSLVSVHSDQDHVLWTVVHIAAHQLVGRPVGEELEEEDEKP